MKTYTLIFCTLFLLSCEGPKKSVKIDIPELPKPKVMEPLTVGKLAGFKCTLSGTLDNKDVFISFSENKDKTITASFHDFKTPTTYNVSASFEKYTLMNFKLNQCPHSENVLTGSGLLMHSDLEGLSDEGKVLIATGKLSIFKDMSDGRIEQSLTILKDDQTSVTEPTELLKIENCEEFEASII